MSDDVRILYPEAEIRRRVADLGAEIGRAFAGREICVLALMKGSIVFMADLIRRIPLDLTTHLVRVSSHHEATATRVMTEIAYSTAVPLVGRHVLVVADIIDTGITLSYLLGHIHELGPASLRVVTLVDKPFDRKIDVHPDWAAFTVPEPLAGRFLVGYGLDWMERYRGLPFIGTIARPAGASPAA
jgi:hypoxanthine phosphoribosyltransferase